MSNEDVQPITVIVAEDEIILRMVAVDFLTDAGFNVIEAPHAAGAIEILEIQFHDVHILFTDIHMPGIMDGLALAHHVKKNWPHIGLLVTSGEGSPKGTDLPEGSRFLKKPYQHAHVINHVRGLKAA
jgi:two-component system, response regulator PdtaR